MKVVTANIFFFSLICLLFIFSNNYAFAWPEHIHKRLTELTYLDNYDYLIKNQLRFVDGSAEPDRIRKKKKWLWRTHQKDAPKRAQNSFNAAIKDFKNRNYAMAARRLGRATHYLQDYGDPSKVVDDFFHGQYGRDIRDLAKRVVDYLLNEKRKGRYATSFWLHLRTENDKVRGYTTKQILSILYKSRGKRAKNMRAIFEDYKYFKIDHNTMQKKLMAEIMLTFATIVACQNRLIELFSQSTTISLSEDMRKAVKRTLDDYLKKWGKKWCTPSWSGCGIVPLNEYNGLLYSLNSCTTKAQLDVVRKLIKCKDNCLMNYISDKWAKQRSECLARCIRENPWSK